MLTLLLLPVILCIGCAIGFAVARIAARVDALQSPAVRIPVTAVAVALLVPAAIFGLEALRYDGGCSGWGERGAHPCSLLEFVFQDWEMGLIFSAIPTVAAIALALYVSSRSGRRSPA